MPQTVDILSSGAICAVGDTMPMVTNAVASGISGVTESPYVNERYKVIRMASVLSDSLPPVTDKLASLDAFSRSHLHMLQMSAYALEQCLSGINISEPLPLFLSAPELLEGITPKLQKGFIQHLQAQTGVDLDASASRIAAYGRAGGFIALQAAQQHLSKSGTNYALLGGVESYRYCTSQLASLDREKRLLLEGNCNGFLPGDAAVFLLLSRSGNVHVNGIASKLKVAYPCCSQEQGFLYSSKPNHAEALTSAIDKACSGANLDRPVGLVLSSLNGELYGVKELGVATLRNKRYLQNGYKHLHPADCLGDIGAAIGPMMIALLSEMDASMGLMCCASDGPARSAVYAWK